MIKQYQMQILGLKEVIETNKMQYTKKKQAYEKLIDQLQSENQKLKAIINEMNMSREQKSINNANVPHNDGDDLSEYELKEHQNISHDTENLLHENNYLKQQIASISFTYQRQISQQLTSCFEKIKTSSRLRDTHSSDSQKVKQANAKVGLLMSAYEKLLKDFDTERQKFIGKIQELEKYLIWTQDSNKKLAYEKDHLEKKLKNSQETLLLFKKNLKI